MTPAIEEDFELELRCLPGVLNVGFRHAGNGEVDMVTLFVRGHDLEVVRTGAVQVASLYFPDASVVVEEAKGLPAVRLGTSEKRIILVRAEFRRPEGVSEVQLQYVDRMGVGRAGSGPLIGGAEATLGALRDLRYSIPFYLLMVNKVDTVTGWATIVTLRSLSDDEDRMGIAWSEDDVVSSAKATLNALNRYVTMDPDRQGEPAASGPGIETDSS